MWDLSAERGVAVLAALGVLLATAVQGGEGELRGLARRAVSEDAAEAKEARAGLRAAGPRGLEALLEARFSALVPRAMPVEARLEESFREAIDAVAAQRHAAASRLYWYTDLEEAKAEARRTGRPILSLRLLGRLDEPFSCANSRFFRTVLYPNRDVSAVLRERFVLHWSSERPAPRVTIDFGDGRRLEGTITGNSIHYVLDPGGRPIDALPGLYGPAAFLRGLRQAEAAVAGYRSTDPAVREAWLRSHHRERLNELAGRWKQSLVRAGFASVAPPWEDAIELLPPGGPVGALLADRVAMTKSAVERPVLRGIYGPAADGPAPDAAFWDLLAVVHRDDAQIDAASLDRMREDGLDPMSEPGAPGTFERTVRSFQRLVAVDSVRNEYALHSRLHRWFSEGSAARDLEGLNTRVYADLFLTPRTDPWLGLVAPDGYSALGGPSWAGR